jgi:hypothetical protein
MTEGGSVWDTGPQYPEMSPEQADGTSAQDAPDDKTPETGSPVDIDTPLPEPAPVAAAPPPEKNDPGSPGWWQGAVLGFPVWILFAFVAVVFVVFIAILRSGDPGTTSADRVQTTEAATTVPSQVVPETTVPAPATSMPTPATAAPTTAPVTTPTTAATTPATAPVTVPLTIPTIPATEPPETVAPTTTPATTRPPTTAPPPTTTRPPATLPPDGPVVTIIGRVGPCDYGPECLLAGFALHNFDTHPNEFVCEFGDGSRYTFRFTRQEVERACATGDPNDSITIEAGGVRSATYTHP